jgi:Type I phosphodiesterase / nucleotide pyrophosphatase
MAETSSVLVLEFNELTPRLMNQWMEQGRLPGFKRLFDESIIYTTDAQEEPPRLEPWIQWITVHTGLPYREHGVFDLGDGHKLTAPRLWDHVSDAGGRVWICGSMNAGASGRPLNGSILPDPWSVGFGPHPAGKFDSFFNLVRTYVQEHTRSDLPLSKQDYARFATFMLRNGLSSKTVRKTIAQLASERVGPQRGHNKWKRAMILDRLLWDMFRSEWRKQKPHYATLFLNSTAHLQHYYWRCMEPEAFSLKPSGEEISHYKDAIFEGYRAMDELVQEACELIAGIRTSLVLLTALSQQPLTKYEAIGGKQMFRPHDPHALLQFAGSQQPAGYSPVMAEEFRLFFDSEEAAREGLDALQGLRLEATPVMQVRCTGQELFTKCDIIRTPTPQARVRSRTGGTAAFDELFYPIENIKSGGHHPDGMLWIRQVDRAHAVIPERVSLRRVAPMLAKLAGLPPTKIEDVFQESPLPGAAERAAPSVPATDVAA